MANGAMIDEEDFNDLGAKLICLECVPNTALRQRLTHRRSNRLCAYCGTRREVVPLGVVAELVDQVFDQHYAHLSEDGEDYYDAYPVIDIIQGCTDLSDEAAEDVRQILEEKHTGRRDYKEGIENPFGEDAHHIDIDCGEPFLFREEWERFKRLLIRETRFFSSDARSILDHIFQGLTTLRCVDGRAVIVIAGADHEVRSIYRARAFDHVSDVAEAMTSPEGSLGSPPIEMAVRHLKAGRMNAQGVSVFYGGTDHDTCIHEIRPSKGACVLSGEFFFLRQVRLLDLDALNNIRVEGDVFEEGYVTSNQRAAFLRELLYFITKPVLPNDEAEEYLPTQAIADYLASHPEFLLDGIKYGSAQCRGGFNIVLFHKAARVQSATSLEVQSMELYVRGGAEDDDLELCPILWTYPPSPVANIAEGQAAKESLFRIDRDYRKPTLRLDRATLKVHNIEEVKIAYETGSLTIRETSRGEPVDSSILG